MRKLLFAGAGVVLVVGLVIISFQLLASNGWSKDIVFDDGRMAIRVQFKVEPDPPTTRSLALMARVKNAAGYPMPVEHVHFTASRNGQNVSETLEGDPIGTFSATGNGFYGATMELPSPGSYQVDLLIMHQQASFNLSWPLVVKQQD